MPQQRGSIFAALAQGLAEGISSFSSTYKRVRQGEAQAAQKEGAAVKAEVDDIAAQATARREPPGDR